MVLVNESVEFDCQLYTSTRAVGSFIWIQLRCWWVLVGVGGQHLAGFLQMAAKLNGELRAFLAVFLTTWLLLAIDLRGPP
jgi:hypothetical protein